MAPVGHFARATALGPGFSCLDDVVVEKPWSVLLPWVGWTYSTTRKRKVRGLVIVILFWSNLTRIYFLLPAVKPDLIMGFLGFLASSIALIGGIFCLRARSPRISVIGAFGAILSLGFFFIGTALGLIALILILASISSFSKAPTDAKSLRAVLGGTAPHFIHIGILLLLIGYSASTYLPVEREYPPTISDALWMVSPIEFEGYELRLVDSEGEDPDNDGNFTDLNAYAEIYLGDSYVGEATFHLWWMDVSGDPVQSHYMLDVYVENTYYEDLYFIGYAAHTSTDGWIYAMDRESSDMFTSDQIDGVSVVMKSLPLMNSLWGGMWMMMLGIGLLVIVDYLPVKVKPRKKAEVKPDEAVAEEAVIEEEEGEVVILGEGEKDYEKMLEEELMELEEEK